MKKRPATRLPRLFRLQWQLAGMFVTASVGVAVFLVLLVVVCILCAFYLSPAMPMALSSEATERIAPVAAPMLHRNDLRGLSAYLLEISGGLRDNKKDDPSHRRFTFSLALDKKRGQRLLLAITNIQGRVRAAQTINLPVPVIDTPLSDFLTDAERGALLAALHGDTAREKTTLHTKDSTAVAAIPLLWQGKVIGAFFIRLFVPFDLGSIVPVFAAYALQVGGVVLLATLFPASIGGFLASRSLTRRFSQIAGATEAWGRGDFSRTAPESAKDELGLFAQRLNKMRAELEDTLRLRQQLAGLQERHRIARDLHDTVKQEVFALNMHLSALHALADDTHGDNAATLALIRERLVNVEHMALEVQQELTGVIQELLPHPIAPDSQATDANLQASLRHLVENWSQYNAIAAELSMDGQPSLRAEARANLLRIVREALANIARHSGATKANVILYHRGNGGEWILTIRDNGRGFVRETTGESEGMGLQNMRERAEALPAGRFALYSALGSGTSVQVSFQEEL